MEPQRRLDPLLTGLAGTRLEWDEIPSGVGRAIERQLGGRVVMAISQPGGFSPALACRLTLQDGSGVFVKAIAPDEISGAPSGQEFYRREAAIAGALPDAVPAPRLIAVLEPEGWVALIFEEVMGSPPVLPWQPPELERVLGAMVGLAETLTPSPVAAPRATVPAGANGWAALATNPGALDGLPGLEPWVRENLDLLAELRFSSGDAHEGPTLLHTGIRADNVLLTSDRVVFVDWPHAKVGAAWLDLVYFLPSVAMQGGGDIQAAFWNHLLARSADPAAVRGVLAGVAGFLIHGASQDPPPGLPGLRRFQLAQGVEALAWLRTML